MTDAEKRSAAKDFIHDWAGRGDEKQETQSFWMALLSKVYGVAEPEKAIDFERRVEVDDVKSGKRTTKFIDGYIPATRVLIEQKGLEIDLKKGYKQSDGSLLSPYQQARRYGGYLPQSQQPRWIVVCNFREFHIHDMNRPNDAPEVVLLTDLEKDYARLQFLVDTGNENIKKEMEISLQAGELVGVLYDALLKQYKDPTDPETLKSLNALCVRLVFCLYAEDAGIFGQRLMFHDYLQAHNKDARRALIDLFRVLDQTAEERDPYMDDDLAAFPYVNGGLFADENIIIPRLDENIVDLILNRASAEFDWSEISPTIFGAVFESTLNPETRRSGGMHYTSIENIHKVIDPLFLDDLKAELEEVLSRPVAGGSRTNGLRAFQDKLAALTFLDPACGSGNFLTETYLSLRRLENRVIAELQQGQIKFGDVFEGSPVKIGIGQFYGIEINDFAVTVAKTALWIAESQMLRETENVLRRELDFLPLKTNAHIVEGNALRLDWEGVVPKDELDYIMGNPPFVGARYQSDEQKADIIAVCIDYNDKTVDKAGFIDYVGGWYYKASRYIQKTAIRCAFVSTNSICQGEQVALLWKNLFTQYGIVIDFAYQTFVWNSEASEQAHVHCVIVGFSTIGSSRKLLFVSGTKMKETDHINGYLLDAPDCFIDRLAKSLWNAPKITNGNRAYDGNNLVLTREEKDELIAREPYAEKYIKKYFMGADLLKNDPRFVIWLVGCSPAELKQMPRVMKRVETVRAMRSTSKNASTKKAADTPTLFQMICQPNEKYLAFPRVSSQRRRYIPMTFLDADCICGDKLIIIPEADLFLFGLLMSNVHNAWMRVIAGRLKSDYSYSSSVYNSFPMPSLSEEIRKKIETTAQAILDARALYPDSSLADLYDEITMPPELRKAHQDNDRAVMRAYGFDLKMTEAQCVAELMKMYQELIADEQR